MSASLVGSEMCIRDSSTSVQVGAHRVSRVACGSDHLRSCVVVGCHLGDAGAGATGRKLGGQA
eukprot:5780584-Alexandrium_andersonii.AAC.1